MERSEITNLGKYHDLYFRSDTVLLADVIENFRNACLEIYELDPSRFLAAPGISWQTVLKQTEVELELLTDTDMLLMVEKCIRGQICYTIRRYEKANKKYIKNYETNKESLCLKYWDVNNMHGWTMSQKSPVCDFIWVENSSKFIEDGIKNYNEVVI